MNDQTWLNAVLMTNTYCKYYFKLIIFHWCIVLPISVIIYKIVFNRDLKDFNRCPIKKSESDISHLYIHCFYNACNRGLKKNKQRR